MNTEKKILFETFNRRSVKRDNTKRLMDNMLKSKKQHIRKYREEEYDSKVSEWMKQGTYDIDKLGHSQKNPSPTSRSSVRPFKKETLHEQQDRLFYEELDSIIEELES